VLGTFLEFGKRGDVRPGGFAGGVVNFEQQRMVALNEEGSLIHL